MYKNICVYCGASVGHHPTYTEAAIKLGRTIAQQGRRLIYGGGAKGLMGVIADTVLSEGGKVIGVIPEQLVLAETAHEGLTELILVSNMHERKAKMAELAEGFVSLPGGIGTFEEFFEIWSWGQIGYHNKPIALLNVHSFYTPMQAFLQHVVNEGFVRQSYLDSLIVSQNVEQLLSQIDAYRPHNLDRWATTEIMQ